MSTVNTKGSMSANTSECPQGSNDAPGSTAVTCETDHPAHLDSSTEGNEGNLMALLQRTAVSASGLSDAALHISAPHPEMTSCIVPNAVLRKQSAYVVITEQPSNCGLEKVLRDISCRVLIKGSTSTRLKATFPAIKVVDYSGPAVVVVSCVGEDGPPYPPHPLQLHHDTQAAGGVCVAHVAPDMTCAFPGLLVGLSDPARRYAALMARQNLKLDSYTTSCSKSQSLDCRAFRLCFQVFLEGPVRGRFTHPLKPVVSQRLCLREDEQPREAEVDSKLLERVVTNDDAPLASVVSANKAAKCDHRGVGPGDMLVVLPGGDAQPNNASCKPSRSITEVNRNPDPCSDLRRSGTIPTSVSPHGNGRHELTETSVVNADGTSVESTQISKHALGSHEQSEGDEGSSKPPMKLVSKVTGSVCCISLIPKESASKTSPQTASVAVSDSGKKAVPVSNKNAAVSVVTKLVTMGSAEPQLGKELNSAENKCNISTLNSFRISSGGSTSVPMRDFFGVTKGPNKLIRVSPIISNGRFAVASADQVKTTEGNAYILSSVPPGSASHGCAEAPIVSAEKKNASAESSARSAQVEGATPCLGENGKSVEHPELSSLEGAEPGDEVTKQQVSASPVTEDNKLLTVRGKNGKVLCIKVLTKHNASLGSKGPSPVKSFKWTSPATCGKVSSPGNVTSEGYVDSSEVTEMSASKSSSQTLPTLCREQTPTNNKEPDKDSSKAQNSTKDNVSINDGDTSSGNALTPLNKDKGSANGRIGAVKENLAFVEDCKMPNDEAGALKTCAATSKCLSSPDASKARALTLVTSEAVPETENKSFGVLAPVKLNGQGDKEGNIPCELPVKSNNIPTHINDVSVSNGYTVNSSLPSSPVKLTPEADSFEDDVPEKLSVTHGHGMSPQDSDPDFKLQLDLSDDCEDDNATGQSIHVSRKSSSETSDVSCDAVSQERSDMIATRVSATGESDLNSPLKRASQTELDKSTEPCDRSLAGADDVGQPASLGSAEELREQTVLDKGVLFQLKLMLTSETAVNSSPQEIGTKFNLHVESSLRDGSVSFEHAVGEKKSIAPLKLADVELDGTESLLKSMDETQSYVSSSGSALRKNIVFESESDRCSAIKSLDVEKLRAVLMTPNDPECFVEAGRTVTTPKGVTFGEVSSTVDIPAKEEASKIYEPESLVQVAKVGEDKDAMHSRITEVALDSSGATLLSRERASPLGVRFNCDDAQSVSDADAAVTNSHTASLADVECAKKKNLNVSATDSSGEVLPHSVDAGGNKKLPGEGKDGFLRVDSSHDKHDEKNCPVNIEENFRKNGEMNGQVGDVNATCQKVEDLANRVSALERKKKHCEKKKNGLPNENYHKDFCENEGRGPNIGTSPDVENEKQSSKGNRGREQIQCSKGTKRFLDGTNKANKLRKDHKNSRSTLSRSPDRKARKESHERSAKNVNHEGRAKTSSSVRSEKSMKKSADGCKDKSKEKNRVAKENLDSGMSRSSREKDASASHHSGNRNSSIRHGDSVSKSKADSSSHKSQHKKYRSKKSPHRTPIGNEDDARTKSNERKEISGNSKEKVGTPDHNGDTDEATRKSTPAEKDAQEHRRSDKNSSVKPNGLECETNKLSSKPAEKTEKKINSESRNKEENLESMAEEEEHGRKNYDALKQQHQEKPDEIENNSGKIAKNNENSLDATDTCSSVVKTAKEITKNNSSNKGEGCSVEGSKVEKNRERNDFDSRHVKKDDVQKLVHNGCTIKRLTTSSEGPKNKPEKPTKDSYFSNEKVSGNGVKKNSLSNVEIASTTASAVAKHEDNEVKCNSLLSSCNDDARKLGEAEEVAKYSREDESKKRTFTEMTDNGEDLNENQKRLKVSTSEYCSSAEGVRPNLSRGEESSAKKGQKDGSTMHPKEMACAIVASSIKNEVQKPSQVASDERSHEKLVESENENSSSHRLIQNESNSDGKSLGGQLTLNESISSDISLPCIDEFSGSSQEASPSNSDVPARPQSSKVSVVVEKLDLRLLGGMTTIDLSQQDIQLSPPTQCKSGKKVTTNTGYDQASTLDHRRKLFTPLKKESSKTSVSPLTRLCNNTSLTICGVGLSSDDRCASPAVAGVGCDLGSADVESRSLASNGRTAPEIFKDSKAERSQSPLTQSGPSWLREKETTPSKLGAETSKEFIEASLAQPSCEKRLLSAIDDNHRDDASAKKRKIDHSQELTWVELLHKNWKSILSISMKNVKLKLTLRKACKPPKMNLTILPKYPYASTRRGSYKHPRLWSNTYGFISRTGSVRYRINEIRSASKRNQAPDRKRLPQLRKSATSTKRQGKVKKSGKDTHKSPNSALNYEVWKKCVQEEYNLRRGRSSSACVNHDASDGEKNIPCAKKYKGNKLSNSASARKKEKNQDAVADSIERVLLRVRQGLGAQSSENAASDLPSEGTKKNNPLQVHPNKEALNRTSSSDAPNGGNLKKESSHDKSESLGDVSLVDDAHDLLSQNELDCISMALREEGFTDVDSVSCEDFSETFNAEKEDSEVSVLSSQDDCQRKVESPSVSGTDENSRSRTKSQSDVKRLSSPQMALNDGSLGKKSETNLERERRNLAKCSSELENTSPGVISLELTPPSRTTTSSRGVQVDDMSVDQSDVLITSEHCSKVPANSPLKVRQENSSASPSVCSPTFSGSPNSGSDDHLPGSSSAGRSFTSESSLKRNDIEGTHRSRSKDIIPERNSPLNASMKDQITGKGPGEGRSISGSAFTPSTDWASPNSGPVVVPTSGNPGRSLPRRSAPAFLKPSSYTPVSISKALLEKIYGSCVATKIRFNSGTLVPSFIFRNPNEMYILHCTRCRYFTSSKHKFYAHESKCNSLMTCDKCSFKTHLPEEMKIHPRMHAKDKHMCYCDECDYVGDNKGSIERHVMVHVYSKDGTLDAFLKFYTSSGKASPEKRCPFCEKFFKNMNEVRAHVREHTNIPSYSCSRCDFIGFSVSAMSKHASVHVKRMLNCPYCSYSSTDRQAIRKHFLTHI